MDGNKDLIIEAIRSQTPILADYPKELRGLRRLHPHALYLSITKEGKRSLLVDAVQVSGVSKTGTPLPSFRRFDLSELRSMTLLSQEAPFEPDRDYEFHSDRYRFAVQKLDPQKRD